MLSPTCRRLWQTDMPCRVHQTMHASEDKRSRQKQPGTLQLAARNCNIRPMFAANSCLAQGRGAAHLVKQQGVPGQHLRRTRSISESHLIKQQGRDAQFALRLAHAAAARLSRIPCDTWLSPAGHQEGHSAKTLMRPICKNATLECPFLPYLLAHWWVQTLLCRGRSAAKG